MAEFKKVLVPDALPNNLRAIRDMRGMSLKEVADGINIDRNFLSAVEAENKNFSGKTTIRALKFYGITFNKMYDVKDRRVLEVTDDFDNVFRTTLEFSSDDFGSDIEMLDSEIVGSDLANNNLIIKKVNEVAKSNKIKGTYDSFNVVGATKEGSKVYLDLEVVYKEKRTEKVEFDINFTANQNFQLADILSYRGFPEVVRQIDKPIDGKLIKIDGNVVKLDQVYKFPKGNSIKRYIESDTIKLSDKRLSVTYDNDTNDPIYVKFKAIKPSLNNLKAIRTLLNISIEEMHKSLGLTYNGYINLELGNQKISTKIMWRLVQKLNVPLELIINIDEYYERYCLVD